MSKHCIIVFVFSLLSTGAIAQISPDSLVLYMPLNGDAADHSPNNYPVQNYNAKPTEGFSGKPGTAYYFDGTNAMVVPNIFKLDGVIKEFSILMLIQPFIIRNGAPFYNFFSWQRLGSDVEQSYEHGKLRIGWSPPNINYHPLYDFLGYFGDWCTGNDRTSNGYEVDTVTANNTWQTIAIIYNRGNLRAYFDCKMMNNWTNFPVVSDLCGTDPMEIILGSVSPGATLSNYRNFIGKIDEIRIYKRALSDDEIQYFADSICKRTMPPKPAIQVTINPCKPNEVAFSDASLVSGATEIDNRVWHVSNGDSAMGKDFSYVFPNTGTYTVKLSLYSGGIEYAKDTVLHISSVSGIRFIKAAQQAVFACSGTAVQLTASGGATYRWDPCTNLSDCHIAAPFVTGTSDMEYVVTAKDANKCVDTAHISLKIIANNNAVYVPNAFTPNGDGNNDIWGVNSINPLTAFNLRIYNRWGINVFTSNNQSLKWDGTIKNQKAPPGVYVWMLSYKNGAGCAAKNNKGTVLLIQ